MHFSLPAIVVILSIGEVAEAAGYWSNASWNRFVRRRSGSQIRHQVRLIVDGSNSCISSSTLNIEACNEYSTWELSIVEGASEGEFTTNV